MPANPRAWLGWRLVVTDDPPPSTAIEEQAVDRYKAQLVRNLLRESDEELMRDPGESNDLIAFSNTRSNVLLRVANRIKCGEW